MKKALIKKSLLFKTLLLVPIIFLFFYHTIKLYNIYIGNDFVTTPEFLNSFTNSFSISTVLVIQNITRVVILTSLIFIIIKNKIGILSLWAGVGTLIITQFIIVNHTDNELIQKIHSGIKPLKGFILPSIITYYYIQIRNTDT